MVENQYTNKHNNGNYEVLIKKFQIFVTSVIFVVFVPHSQQSDNQEIRCLAMYHLSTQIKQETISMFESVFSCLCKRWF